MFLNRICLCLLLFSSSAAYAQSDSTSQGNTGIFLSLGLRSTVSAFADDGASGMGTGGQFRLRFGNRFNTEWFADYITTNLKELAARRDYHIGWSVMFYPFSYEKKFTPYFLAGHCFDYTEVERYSDRLQLNRWSSAVQSGIGTHFNLTKRFDLSLSAQYMIHLGNEIETILYTDPGTLREDYAIAEKELSLEGHLLVTFSLNVYIARLGRGNKEIRK